MNVACADCAAIAALAAFFTAPGRGTNPDLQRTPAKKARWYVRPVVCSGPNVSKQRRIYLGDVATMTREEAELRRRRVLALANLSAAQISLAQPFKLLAPGSDSNGDSNQVGHLGTVEYNRV